MRIQIRILARIRIQIRTRARAHNLQSKNYQIEIAHSTLSRAIYINILIFRLSNIDLLGNWFAVSLATHTQSETHSQLNTCPRAPCAASDRLRSDRIGSDRNGSVWLSSAWIGWVNLGGVQAPRYYCRRQTNWPDAEFGAFITNRQRLRRLHKASSSSSGAAAVRQSGRAVVVSVQKPVRSGQRCRRRRRRRLQACKSKKFALL